MSFILCYDVLMDEHSDQADWTAVWGEHLTAIACEACNSTFLLEQPPSNCPYCGQKSIAPLANEAMHLAHTQPPELTIPFLIKEEQVAQKLQAFSKRFWFAPSDMTLAHLRERTRPFFLPMWLVDSDATAQWGAEMGFDYDVVSHREKYRSGKWETEQIIRTQIRWEARVGTVERRYDNHPAPALEEHDALRQKIGAFKSRHARPFSPNDIKGRAIRLPDRAPEDAWTEAEASIKTAAIDQCRQASAAEHIRDFKWAAQFSNKEWTQLLLPVYTTYYQDDDGRTHPLIIHGQNGRLHGMRRASSKKAKRWSITIAAIALLTLCLSMIVGAISLAAEEAILPFAVIIFFGGMIIAMAALIPFIIVWYVNSKSEKE